MSFKSQSCSSYSFKYSVNMCACVCVHDGIWGQACKFHICVLEAKFMNYPTLLVGQ